jgi:hypothetical protein
MPESEMVKVCFRVQPATLDAFNELAKGKRGLRELVIGWLGQQPGYEAIARKDLERPDGRRKRPRQGPQELAGAA